MTSSRLRVDWPRTAEAHARGYERQATHSAAFDVERRRAPSSRSLQQHVHGKPLVYLDNAATTQKPRR